MASGFKPATGFKSDAGFKSVTGLTGYKPAPGFKPAEGSGLPASKFLTGKFSSCELKGTCGAYADSDAAMGALALPSSEEIAQDWDAFVESPYSYEDAEHVLAVFDGIETINEAKAFIGGKIRAGLESSLKRVGITPNRTDRHETLRAFDLSGYSNADARQLVANTDFLSSVEDAKDYIGLKIINNAEDSVEAWGIVPKDPTEYFLNAGYTDADAERVLNRLPTVGTIEGAREYIGRQVAHGKEDVLVELGIGRPPAEVSREAALNAFASSQYTREDAFAAKREFGIPSVDEAREFIGRMILSGKEIRLAEVGINPSNFDHHECVAHFRRSGYTSSDARAAVRAFDFLDSVPQAKAYIGLKIANGNEDVLRRAGITPQPYDRHEQLDAYHASAYTTADCDRLVEHADFIDNRKDAKAYIGLKIINGNERALERFGIERPAAGE